MLLIVLLLLSIFPILIGNENAKAVAHVLLFLFSLVGMYGCYTRKDILSFLTPCKLIFFYTSVSLALGAWGFDNGYVLVEKDLNSYEAWEHADTALASIMLCLTVMYSIDHVLTISCQSRLVNSNRNMSLVTLLSAVPLTFFIFFPLNLTFLGAEGDLSILPKSVLAILLIIYISRFSFKFRVLFYFLLVLFFATFSIHEKREAIFLLFPILFLEFMRYRTQFNFKLAMLGSAVLCFIVFLILIMSVARGYGGFGQFDSLSEALPFVYDYMVSEHFISGFLHNVEGNYFFFHAMNSIELIVQDPNLISFGSTLIKPLFIPFPREIFLWKPDSIITLYTSAYDPVFRSQGGSWPISIFSEFFWNFAYLAPFFSLIISMILVRAYFYMLKVYEKSEFYMLGFLLFCYMHLLTVARGSGVDQYVVYIVIGGFFFVMCKFISFLITAIINSREKK